MCKAVYLAANLIGIHHPAIVPLKGEILGLKALFGQVIGHRPHVGGDGHTVVVENDQQLLAAGPGVGQPLIGQTTGEGPVADEGHDFIVLPQRLPGPDHTQSHRHRVGGVAGDEGVVDALYRFGEAGDSAVLPQGGHGLPPPGEDLVAVALVAHVKDQAVLPGVEHPMDGHRQLHCP